MGWGWLENLVDAFSPRRAWERAVVRDAIRAFDAADSGRLNAGWYGPGGTAEQLNAGSREMLRQRARDVERNSDILDAAMGAFERNVIGTGFRLQALAETANGELDEALNERLERYWRIWCKPRNCDVTGQQSFAELCRMALRRRKVDGGILFLKTYTEGGLTPFKLQAREVDDLDLSMVSGAALPDGGRIVNGVELDSLNRPRAYYLRTVTPDGLWTGKSERIPADRVIFLFQKLRPSQVRELCEVAATLSRIRDMESFMQAVSVKERVAACFAMFVSSELPNSQGSIGRAGSVPVAAATAPDVYPSERLEPGLIKYGRPGEDAKAIVPPNHGQDARTFVSLQQRLAAAGMGLSYEAASRDLSQVNYSSARQGRLEDQAEYDIEAAFFDEHLLAEVWPEFVRSLVLVGRLTARDVPGFWADQARYLGYEASSPGMAWIDPLKEVKANTEALSTGQSTLREVCGRRGGDWREVARQRVREEAFVQEERRKAGLDAAAVEV